MQNNDTYNEVVRLLSDNQLGAAIDTLDKVLNGSETTPLSIELHEIRKGYHLMANYWQAGYADDGRQALFESLQHRTHKVAATMLRSTRKWGSRFFAEAYTRPRASARSWGLDSLKAEMENYVSSLALLSLEPEDKRRESEERLFDEHFKMLADLFDYIWTAHPWKETTGKAFEELLLSPTIDSSDQQLIVSAVTMALLDVFDIQKFTALTNVYLNTTDEQVRQRALVGWVLGFRSVFTTIYPQMNDIVRRLLADERVRHELTELQMQIVYCLSSENDGKTITEEIMPEIIKGNNIKVTKRGIEEMDEDSLSDILHPEEAEKNMERMEQSVRRIVDMQKQGSDVYFSSFSQMKRFPFFIIAANWFLPFNQNHPDVRRIWNEWHGSKILSTILKANAFCDSDCYSFVLAFKEVFNHLPKSMRDMIEKGEGHAVPVAGEFSDEESSKPAFIRRRYLQNFYRFCSLYAYRSEYSNPFKNSQSLFYADKVLLGAGLKHNVTEVAAFLYKRERYDDVLSVLKNVPDDSRDITQWILLGRLENDASHFRKALEIDPDNRQALSGYAKACRAEGDDDEALATYRRLQQLAPDRLIYQLHEAECLVALGQMEEATKILFRLNYMLPDSDDVNRSLAWALMLSGRYDQAEKYYTKLTAKEHAETSDWLHFGYSLWISGRVADAAAAFRKAMKTEQGGTTIDIVKEFSEGGAELLRSHGISDIEVRLMTDTLLYGLTNDNFA